MKVKPDGLAAIDLGTTETTPTIGITDYSRRVTDDFGVTTVVERGFSRRMSVRMALPTDTVDAVQRQLANLRATSALWIADASLQWLNVVGFYKDFALDLAVPPLSFCTLTVEGLAETEVVADAGGDPAPAGSASTLRLLQPITVDDAQLFAASVPENDAATWASGTTYADGARVIRAHRIWESLVNGNVGNDPTSTTGSWLDTGPTNRWAMFDQALGTATTATGSLSATLAPSAPIGAVAFLDAAGATVRVQVTSGSTTVYDQSVAVGGRGVVTFTGLPQTANLKVIATLTGASGSAPVSLGTLLAGAIVALGITEASPSAGITDYSRKEVDDFGAVTIVQRAWAKRMTAQALIRSDAVDLVANRIAAVRARPSLWIGDSGFDSLSVYGFFKDFSIEVGDTVSKLSLSIEGLSKAAPPAPPFGNGQSVVAQGSVDGVAWHLGLLDGDVYMRISNDSGATFGPAIRIVGEDGEAGEDGAYQQQIFRRSPTQPATPTGGGIPAGWSDGVPAGTDPIWLSVQYQRNGIALGPWSTPARITGDKGEPGQNAPLVLVQWSVDGVTGWHTDYADGDKFQRQSVDGGQTYGPAVRVVGESAESGVDGTSPSIVFRRSPTIPATPATNSGNPPPGWSDAPPAGSDFLWQTKATFRNATQLTDWSAPVRITGQSGASAFTMRNVANMAVEGDRVTKTGGGFQWNGMVESAEGGANVLFSAIMRRGTYIGLTANPNVASDFGAIDYALHWSDDAEPRIRAVRFGTEAASIAEAGSGVSEGLRFTIRSEDDVIIYAFGSNELHRHPANAIGQKLYACVAIALPANYVSGLALSISGRNGTEGPAGYNNATVTIYRRAASQPALPTQPATWTFATASLAGLNNGWSTSIPSGTDPVWAAAATASSQASTDTIATNEWTSPVQAFANGGSGVNTKSLFIYQRAVSAPALPSQNAVYTFSSATLTGLNNGWTPTIPDGSGTVWVSTATALSPTDNDNINPGEWAAVAKLAQDGAAGKDALLLSISPASHSVGCDFGGTPKADQGSKSSTLRVTSGDTVVTGGVTFSIAGTSDCAASVSGSTLTLSSFSDDEGYADVTAAYGAASQTARVSFSKARDGAPGASAATAISGPSGSSYADLGPIIKLAVQGAGTITGSASWNSPVNTSTKSGGLRILYRIAGDTTWSQLAEDTNSAPANEPFDVGAFGSIATSAAQVYEFVAQGYRTGTHGAIKTQPLSVGWQP